MNRFRVGFVAAAVAIVCGTAVPAARAAELPAGTCAPTTGQTGVSGNGTYKPSSITGGLPGWPTMTDAGYYRIEYLALVCFSGVPAPEQGIEIWVGKSLFIAEIDSLERIGSQTVGWGNIQLQENYGAQSLIFEGRVELTVRDRSDLSFQQTDTRTDTVKLRIFSKTDLTTPVAVIKGAIWGNRITSVIRA
jgi:hypothetical protein